MATVIDALLVTLGLDSSGFTAGKNKVDKGLKETGSEADKAGKKLKQSGKDASDGFKDAAASATKFLALIGGTMAIKSFVQQQIEANAALERLSKNLNISANTLSAFEQAAERAGGTADGMAGTMDMLSKSQTELMLTGNSSLIPYFSALGVSMADAGGKARPVNDILLELSDRFGKMDRQTANNMGRMMGIDQGTMNLLIRGRGEVENMLRRQKEYAAVSEKQAALAEKLRSRMVESRQNFEAFGRTLLERATPALEKMMDIMSSFGAWCRENQEFIEDFLKIVGAGLIALGLAVTPINLTIVAVTALAAGIAALWQDYQTWKRGGHALIDWDKWAPGIEAAKNGLKALRDVAHDAFFRIFAGVDMVASALKGDWGQAKIAGGLMIEGSGVFDKKNSAPAGNPQSSKSNTPNPTAQQPTAQQSPSDAQSRMASLEKQYGIPAGLLDRMWATESGRGKNMRSGAGAKGHFQFMDDTAKQYGLKNPDDFNESSGAAARYLADLNRQFGGDWEKTIAAYNWGPGNVQKKGLGRMPKETQNYLKKLLPNGAPGAASFAAGAGAGGGAAGGSTTTIGEMNISINTQATDAQGISQDIGKHVNYVLTAHSNSGLA